MNELLNEDVAGKQLVDINRYQTQKKFPLPALHATHSFGPQEARIPANGDALLKERRRAGSPKPVHPLGAGPVYVGMWNASWQDGDLPQGNSTGSTPFHTLILIWHSGLLWPSGFLSLLSLIG